MGTNLELIGKKINGEYWSGFQFGSICGIIEEIIDNNYAFEFRVLNNEGITLPLFVNKIQMKLLLQNSELNSDYFHNSGLIVKLS